jgi:class 3 adenylate cyclase
MAGIHGIDHVDLCIFSTKDLEGFPEVTNLYSEGLPSLIRRCADATGRKIRETKYDAEHKTGTVLTFPALATNFPNISDPTRDELRNVAVVMLASCLTLAQLLEIGVVEIVCGRRVIHTLEDNDKAHVISSPMDGQAVRRVEDAFVDGIRLAYDFATKALEFEPGVAIALEVEPGATFLANSLQEAGELIARLRRHMPTSKHKFGLNLDIGHMLLIHSGEHQLLQQIRVGGECSEAVSISDLIIHSHISDHEKAHFADAAVGKFHKLDDFEPWLRAYCAAGDSPKRSDYYTGVIAIEMEASENVADMTRSYSAVQYLIGGRIKPSPKQRFTEKHLAVLFADIRSSTEIEIQLAGPEEALVFSEFYAEMAKCVRDNGGVVDKFIGDCVMALFLEKRGEIPPEAQALRCAKAMVRRSDELAQRRWNRIAEQKWGVRAGLVLGVGINSGNAMVGDFGPCGMRAWTAIGPTVIVAERVSHRADSNHRVVFTNLVRESAGTSEGELLERNADPLTTGHYTDLFFVNP